MPRISCDSALCQYQGDFTDEERGIEGVEAELFAKVGSQQVLMPLVLAKKLKEDHE